MRQRRWLSTRSAAFQDALLSKAVVRLLKQDEFLYHIGDPGDGLYCVLSGSIKISVPSDDGQESVSHQYGSGYWIGDLAMLASETRLVSIMASSECRVVVITAPHIQNLLRETPEFYRDFYALSHENMRIALRTQANMAVLGAERRLALRLLQIEEGLATDDGWILLSQDELAAMVAVSLPTIQRLLRKLSHANVVELGYGRIRILDHAGLIAVGEI